MRTATRGLDNERPSVFTSTARHSFQKCFTQRKTRTGSILRPLRFPIAALRLAFAPEFRFAFDGLAADFAGVLDGELVALALAGHFEGDFAVLVLPVFD